MKQTGRVVLGMAMAVGIFCWAAWAQPPAPSNPPPTGPGGPMTAPPLPPPRGPEAPPPADANSAKQLVQEILTARLARELALSDEQTVIMLKRFTEYRAQLEAFRKERQELTKALRASIAAKEPESQIETRLKALAELDGKVVEYKRSLYDSASEGLTVAQRAKLYVFLSDFENDMRKLIQKAREQAGQRSINRWIGPPPEGGPPHSAQPPRGIRNRQGPPGMMPPPEPPNNPPQ
ncbi:MAG TPA: hypothetical protein PKO36_08100 [Candidatus Hydrogenedentes bacterium]|nr:hypothetical protein [Candidatus Hydrogenedentota bacterium]